MALTTDQKASKLFKKLQGTSETTTVKQFFEEGYLGRVSVFHQEQIWNQSDLIPSTAPVLSNGQISGVVQYFQDKELIAVPGLTNSFFHSDLKDTIPFNYSDGSYNYRLTNSNGTLIPFGMGDWLVDTEAGVLTFYSSVPSNMPPKISFYKYIGTKGAGGSSQSLYKSIKTLTNTDILNKYIEIGNPITTIFDFIIQGACDQIEGMDYEIGSVNTRVTWNGLTLDGQLRNGHVITIIYN